LSHDEATSACGKRANVLQLGQNEHCRQRVDASQYAGGLRLDRGALMRRTQMTAWKYRLALLVVTVIPATALAQTPTPDPDLQKALDARRAAERANDVEAWNRYTVDGFLSTTPDGRVDTKAERAILIRNRKREDSAALIEEPKLDLKWRMYGDTAIETFRWDNAPAFRRPVRITEVWVKRNGVWQVAGNHVSFIEKR
jgi:hypothetical protein